MTPMQRALAQAAKRGLCVPRCPSCDISSMCVVCGGCGFDTRDARRISSAACLLLVENGFMVGPNEEGAEQGTAGTAVIAMRWVRRYRAPYEDFQAEHDGSAEGLALALLCVVVDALRETPTTTKDPDNGKADH